MTHHRIDVVDLEFAYPDGTEALRGVCLAASHGESIALVGANGAGKSTLLQHLVGLHHPQAGTVGIGEVPVTHETLADVRKSVGMVFQDPDDQLFMPTVAEDVAFGPVNLGLPAEVVEERVSTALSTVGASALRDRPPYRLSGGEKRAVAIATVLAMNPSVLVMDEPSSNLDPKARRRLIGLLATFRHTKLIATHDLELALELCERTVVMREGRVAADGPTREVFADAELLDACGLEQPTSMLPCGACGASAGIIAS
jgi:cobalt/nickel transport system ATP-binding protein